ncbi:MAG: hypothetical protein LBF78_10500, partial [Treponema sp.]|nr:hypothetical protein [Treponema sp.]
FYYQKQIGDKEATSEGYVHNTEDDDVNQTLYMNNRSQGRFRMNLQIDKENMGMKVRFQQDQWTDQQVPKWDYAFAYGHFLNNQLKISAGKLGDSPWGAAGPEMWTELDTRIGIRTEISPNILPGLNVGFVLNDYNAGVMQSAKTQTIGDILRESVMGIAYTHDLLALRFSYRMDSENDEDRGAQLVYRLEERVLQNYLENFQIWANGWYQGLASEDKSALELVNWLYFQYAPQSFTAQFRLGYNISEERHILQVRPAFYYNFFDNFLNVGASFQFTQDFGENKMYKDSPYLRLQVEPMIRVNFGTAYIALVYQYRNEYATKDKDEVTNIHWVNLRVVYTF